MKTVIEYSDSADDHMALMRALKSTDMACLLFEIKINNVINKIFFII